MLDGTWKTLQVTSSVTKNFLSFADEVEFKNVKLGKLDKLVIKGFVVKSNK